MSSSLQDAQREMASFLRDPQGLKPPAGIEARRLQIYRDLVYRNIEGFISTAFPVLRSLYEDAAWETLVRRFILEHRCKTPLFLRISEEFLEFLTTVSPPPGRCFEAELAHYEWLELAVDVVDADVPPLVGEPQLNRVCASLAPTARLGSYQFPVHRIGPSFQPEEGAPTFLLVYRDRERRVQFMELSAASARLLLEVVQDSRGRVDVLLERLAQEWDMDAATLSQFAWEQLLELHQKGVIALHEIDV